MLGAAAQSAPHAVLNRMTSTERAFIDALRTSQTPYFTSGFDGYGLDVALDLYHCRATLEHVFEVGSPSVYRPEKLPQGLNVLAGSRGWASKQRRVHIVVGPDLREAWVTDKIETRPQSGSSTWTTIVHWTNPTRDWTTLLPRILVDGPAVVVLDYRLTADIIGVPRFAPGHPETPVVYLQYAPIRQRPGEFPYRIFSDGFIWATLHGLHNDAEIKGRGTNDFWRAQTT